MPPIHEYENWAIRHSDDFEEVEPLRKYVFICEGENSEVRYFKSLINKAKHLGIHPLVDIHLWEKTGDDKGITNPRALVRFAQREKHNPSLRFDPEIDRMVIVFDLDIYCRVGSNRTGSLQKDEEFRDLLDEVPEKDILAYTSPSFELFLMLHREGAYDSIIKPHARELIANQKEGSRRYAQVLFTNEYGMNPKSNPAIGNLVDLLDEAIKEEQNLNQDIGNCLTCLTSNVGSVIERIRQDQPDPHSPIIASNTRR